MSDADNLDALLEAALHAMIAQRCERAYVHDLRNGLQSIYTSLEVLTRMLEGKATPTLPKEKVAAMARKAINAYELSLAETAKRLIMQNDAPLVVNVGESLRELCAFLRNDATARGIALQATEAGELFLRARPSQFRLALLSVAVRIIDSLPGGELRLSPSAAEDSVQIEILARPEGVLSDDSLWRLESASPQDDWTLYATLRLLSREGASIDAQVVEASESSASKCRKVQLRYPAARPSS